MDEYSWENTYRRILDQLTKLETQIIFHYTSPDALLKILNKDNIELRFTRNDCVNDTLEGKHIIEIYSKTCEELLAFSKISKEFYDLIIKSKPRDNKLFFKEQKMKHGSVTIAEQDTFLVYLCCFSSESDSLPMWNYYVKNGMYQGVCIGFDTNLFDEYHDSRQPEKFGDIDLRKVIYSDSEKKDIFIKILLALFESFDETQDESVGNIEVILSSLLLELQYISKSECFAHEKEIRAIMKIPISKKVNKCYRIQYDSKGSYIIPFTLVSIDEKRNLREITIGPLAEKELSKSIIFELLESRGYDMDEKNIQNSKIPIRF